MDGGIMGAGRPVTYTESVLKELIKKLNKYCDSEEIPILAEFAYKNNIRRQALYEHPELTDAIKRITEKKEAQLERNALLGAVNPTMAIFSLKQLGWKDKQEIDLNHGVQPDTEFKIVSKK